MIGSAVLLQFSDLHIGGRDHERDPAAAFAAAIEAASEIGAKPDGVLLSGDLTENGQAGEYELVAELVEQLRVSVFPLPGNHDDREALRHSFSLPGTGAEPVLYTADAGEIRLVVLDTVEPGADFGALDELRLAWLESELSAARDRLVVLAMHHAPIAIGNPAWDEIGLPADDRQALAEIIGRHPQIRRIVCGHLHRAVEATFAGHQTLVAPSTYLQAQLELGPHGGISLSASAPPGFLVHVACGGQLASHIQLVAELPDFGRSRGKV